MEMEERNNDNNVSHVSHTYSSHFNSLEVNLSHIRINSIATTFKSSNYILWIRLKNSLYSAYILCKMRALGQVKISDIPQFYYR